MKGQQKTADTEEGTVQIQEGAVATGEDPTSVAIASIQSAATFPDPNVKYVFRTENGGQVMYRVIQVSEGQLDGQTEGTGAISGYPATQSMTQAVIQGAFTSDDAVDTEGTAAETHYTYFPSTAVGDGAAGTTSGGTAAVVTTQGSEALLGQATPPGTGQFFVMMSPQEVLQGGSQRSIAPRTHPYSPKSEAPRTTRDEKRRAQHNEVERRRRDKINNWIVQLSKIIPDCSMESTKSGQVVRGPWGRHAGARPPGACGRGREWAPQRWPPPPSPGPRETRPAVPSPGRRPARVLVSCAAPSCRAKAASCPKPATTSRSCGRATTGCRKSCRGLTSCSWTTTSSDSRWRISKTRTCCCEPSCGTTAWRSSSRVTATSGGPGASGPHPRAGLQTPWRPQASPAPRPGLAGGWGRPGPWLGAGGVPGVPRAWRAVPRHHRRRLGPARHTPGRGAVPRLCGHGAQEVGSPLPAEGPVTGRSDAPRRCWARAFAAAQGVLGSGGCPGRRRPAAEASAEASGAGRTTGRASRDRSLRGRSFSFPFSFLPFFLF